MKKYMLLVTLILVYSSCSQAGFGVASFASLFSKPEKISNYEKQRRYYIALLEKDIKDCSTTSALKEKKFIIDTLKKYNSLSSEEHSYLTKIFLEKCSV